MNDRWNGIKVYLVLCQEVRESGMVEILEENLWKKDNILVWKVCPGNNFDINWDPKKTRDGITPDAITVVLCSLYIKEVETMKEKYGFKIIDCTDDFGHFAHEHGSVGIKIYPEKAKRIIDETLKKIWEVIK